MLIKYLKQQRHIKKQIAMLNQKLYGDLDKRLNDSIMEMYNLVVECESDHKRLAKLVHRRF